jgi:UDP-glucose 4-epimerase
MNLGETYVAALNYLESPSGSEVVSLGTGGGICVFEIVSEFSQISGEGILNQLVARRALAKPVMGARASRIDSLVGRRREGLPIYAKADGEFKLALISEI